MKFLQIGIFATLGPVVTLIANLTIAGIPLPLIAGVLPFALAGIPYGIVAGVAYALVWPRIRSRPMPHQAYLLWSASLGSLTGVAVVLAWEFPLPLKFHSLEFSGALGGFVCGLLCEWMQPSGIEENP